eukprot:8188461-Pyramimonas_sp.AAC.1
MRIFFHPTYQPTAQALVRGEARLRAEAVERVGRSLREDLGQTHAAALAAEAAARSRLEDALPRMERQLTG